MALSNRRNTTQHGEDSAEVKPYADRMRASRSPGRREARLPAVLARIAERGRDGGTGCDGNGGRGGNEGIARLQLLLLLLPLPAEHVVCLVVE